MENVTKQGSSRSAQVNASLAAAAMAALGFCNSAHATVLLETVYGDGAFPKTGNPYFQYDYIELYNSGATTASLTGLWLDMSGFATEPIAYSSTRTEIPLPIGATIAPGGYYLIQINDGTSSPAFVGPAQYTAPTPDVSYVYSSTQTGYNPTYDSVLVGTSYVGWTNGNLFSDPYFGAGKIALVQGGSNGTMVDYLGYGPGLASGSVPGTFGSNNFWSSFPGYLGTAYAGYNYLLSIYGSSSAIPTSADALGSSMALYRTNNSDSYALGEDNNSDWSDSDVFTLTNSAGQTLVVPEPATVGLMAAGSALLLARRRSRKS